MPASIVIVIAPFIKVGGYEIFGEFYITQDAPKYENNTVE